MHWDSSGTGGWAASGREPYMVLGCFTLPLFVLAGRGEDRGVNILT